MSNSSLPNHRRATPAASSENRDRKIASSEPLDLFPDREPLLKGAFDDAEVIRRALVQSIKASGMSRVTIADMMTDLLGRQVTEKMLNAFTAESRDDRRWPAEFDRAFCEATGDYSLIRVRAEMAGLRIITHEEGDLLELGRAYRQRDQAEKAITRLNAKLDGGGK